MKTLVERLGAFGVTRNWAKAVSERLDWLLENAEWVRELVGGPSGVEKPDGSHIVDTEDIVQNYVRALAENKAMKEEAAHMKDVVSIYEDTDKELREQNERLRTRVKSWKEEVAQANGVRADAVRLEYGRNKALTKEVAHLNDVIRELKKLDWKDNSTQTSLSEFSENLWAKDWGVDYMVLEAQWNTLNDDNRELRLKVQTLEADREVLLLRLQRALYRVWAVRITKAGLPTYWYADKIGETFEVFDAGMDGLGLKEDAGKVDAEQRNIQRGDCEKVTT